MITSRERLLLSIKGEETDRLAWSPFLPYFWESLSEDIRKKGMLEFYKYIGADPLFRGFCTIINIKRNNVTRTETINGNKKQVLLETPVGNLPLIYTYAEESSTWFLTDHPIKCEDDYKKLIYIYENMEIEPNLSKYKNGIDLMGEEALLIPIISPEMKTSFQSLVETWVGTEQLSYDLYDFPETIEECLAIMKEKSKVSAHLACECDAEAFIFWEDSSTMNVSPTQFEKYAADEISMWADILHANGKYLIHHACGSIRNLIEPMCRTGIDMIESISPPPTGDIYTYEARKIMPENVGLIGGIEPTVLLRSTMKELETYVSEIIEKTGTRKFILGNSDSCPPGVEIEKFKMISELVKNWKSK